MLYDFDVTVPPATQQGNPQVTPIHVGVGLIRRIGLDFPPGPAKRVFIQVSHSLHTLMPANPEGAINLDDREIWSDMEYIMNDGANDLLVIGWSPLAVYEHTITVYVDMGPLPDQSWVEFNAQLEAVRNAR